MLRVLERLPPYTLIIIRSPISDKGVHSSNEVCTLQARAAGSFSQRFSLKTGRESGINIVDDEVSLARQFTIDGGL